MEIKLTNYPYCAALCQLTTQSDWSSFFHPVRLSTPSSRTIGCPLRQTARPPCTHSCWTVGRRSEPTGRGSATWWPHSIGWSGTLPPWRWPIQRGQGEGVCEQRGDFFFLPCTSCYGQRSARCVYSVGGILGAGGLCDWRPITKASVVTGSCRQAGRRKDRKTEKQTYRDKDRQAGRWQTGIQTVRLIGRQTGR